MAERREDPSRLTGTAATVAARAEQREIEIPPLDLSWMPQTKQWGIRAKVGKKGLTLGAINIGIYGEVPDRWANLNLVGRGAIESPSVMDQGFTVFEKQEVWAEHVADLYEEAIQRRWIPATDIPWETLQLQPEDWERAMCQLCTELSERALVTCDAVCQWVQRISYGFHEVKCFLATVIADTTRHHEAFRKRALANGGGLGLQTPQWGHRNLITAKNYTEFTMLAFLLEGSRLITLCRYGQALSRSEAESKLFTLTLQDLMRHQHYAMEHLQYTLAMAPRRRDELLTYLSNGESFKVRDEILNTALPAAIAILAGGNMENVEEGRKVWERLRKEWIERYVAVVEWAGLREHKGRLNAFLAQWAGMPVPEGRRGRGAAAAAAASARAGA